MVRSGASAEFDATAVVSGFSSFKMVTTLIPSEIVAPSGDDN
jgi:hypothetical protein